MTGLGREYGKKKRGNTGEKTRGLYREHGRKRKKKKKKAANE